MVTKRDEGRLLVVMGNLIIGRLGSVAPPYPRASVFAEINRIDIQKMWFTNKVAPLDYLYILDLASKATGFEVHRTA